MSEGLSNAVNKAGEGLGNAVSKAVENAVAPAAEKLANKAAEHLNATADAIGEVEKTEESTGKSLASALENLTKATENFRDSALNAIWNTALKEFPKWELCPVSDINSEEGDDYAMFSVFVNDLTDENIEEYQNILKANGFTGDFQIMKKKVNDREYIVDFTFVPDSQINYMVR